jgi:hypothetical protein
MRHARAAVLAITMLAAALAACSDEDATSTDPPSIPSGAGAGPGAGAAIGPGISVAEARRSRLDGPLLVRGYVLAEGSNVRLCDALLESFPPQCGAPSLEVRGFDLAALPGIQSSGNVRWSDQQRLLLGEVTNGVLNVSSTSRG